MKYGNRKVKYKGRVFDSKKEEYRFAVLELLQKNGKIKDLRTQVKYELIPRHLDPNTKKVLERAINYIADFVYVDTGTGETVVEDTKGFRTKDYIIKRKLMLYVYGIRIYEV